MKTARNALLVFGLLFLFSAGPALAGAPQEPIIDLENTEPFSEFYDRYPDTNGDGIPEIPVGTPGEWADNLESLTPEGFVDRIGPGVEAFLLAEGDPASEGSTMIGPCGGIIISYEAVGTGPDGYPKYESLDLLFDMGDDKPMLDLYGNQAGTSGNPFEVDSEGAVAYFGFTRPVTSWSKKGNQPDEVYDPEAHTFHDWKSRVDVAGISVDHNGDPNPTSHNRNAGLIFFTGEPGVDNPPGTYIDIPGFFLKTRAVGAGIDLWGPDELPEVNRDNIAALAAGREYCFGEIWVQFIGDPGDIVFSTPGMAAAALAAIGFLGIMINARPATTWRA